MTELDKILEEYKVIATKPGTNMLADNKELADAILDKIEEHGECPGCGADLSYQKHWVKCSERKKPLTDTFDAREWAKEFMQMYDQSTPKDTINEDLMVSWFSNALLCGYDHAKRQESEV